MKCFLPWTGLLTVASLTLTLTTQAASRDWSAGFQEGKLPLQSVSQIAFGPGGILFVADTKAATIFAVATGDNTEAAAQQIRVEGLDQKLAALVGAAPDQILIHDLAVNPVSHLAYLSASRGRGPAATPLLARVSSQGQVELLPLDKVKFSKAEVPDAPADATVGEGRRQSNPRLEAITDIAFLEDRVLVAGLSNEEFASTLRSIPFPFKSVEKGASVEIYHGAHGRYETRAPIRTFVPFNVGNQPQLLAAYTCTPLVQLPLKAIQPGAKLKGKTIAELGNRNRPLDMIVYQKDGKDFLLLANSSRGVMKVETDKLEAATGIVEPVKDGATQGLHYQTIEGWKGVDQLDRLDAQFALVLRKTDAGNQILESLPLP